VYLSADRGVRGVSAHTPLHALHVALGARMTPFAGFDMPLQYAEGIKTEHLWTRAHAGLFDVSHMGQVRVAGEHVEARLERALPLDFDGWSIGRQRYSLLLDDAGGVVDDVMVLRLPEGIRIVVNASGRERDLAWLRSRCPGLAFELADDALLALQGPAAEAVLAPLAPAVARLAFMQAAWCGIDGVRALVVRSGYTGEDGFEIAVPAEHAERVARRLLEHAEVKAIGLGARDTLRLEAGLPLHGQDIDTSARPAESGLAWAIAPARRAQGGKAGGFPGAAAVLADEAHGPARVLAGFIGVEPVPVRAGALVEDAAQRTVGSVTSGTVSPSLGQPICLARVDAAATTSALFARVRGQARPLRRVALPFVAKRYRRTPAAM
jgi:aminomethyltransferase